VIVVCKTGYSRLTDIRLYQSTDGSGSRRLLLVVRLR
jgi:hypothetical protein